MPDARDRDETNRVELFDHRVFLRRFLAGDHRAVSVFQQRIDPMTRKWLRRKQTPQVYPDDLIINVSSAAWQFRHSFNPDDRFQDWLIGSIEGNEYNAEGKFSAWLKGIMHHKFCDLLNPRETVNHDLANDSQPVLMGPIYELISEVEIPTSKWARNMIQGLAESQSDLDKQILFANKDEPKWALQIGIEFGVKRNTVAKHWERLKKKFHELIVDKLIEQVFVDPQTADDAAKQLFDSMKNIPEFMELVMQKIDEQDHIGEMEVTRASN